VLVCTVRALKLNSNAAAKVVAGAALPQEYVEERLDLVQKGSANLLAHIRNVTNHGVKVVVAVNRFHTDTDAEIALVARLAKEGGAFDAVEAAHFAYGGKGAAALGHAVMAACASADPARDFKFLYELDAAGGIKGKIEAIVRGAYGGDGATYSDSAEARIQQYERDATLKRLPICMSKTQYSLTDDATKLGAPRGFKVHVKDIYVSAGAGFLVASLGAISFIPGLPIKPAYYKIDLDMSHNPPRVVGLS